MSDIADNLKEETPPVKRQNISPTYPKLYPERCSAVDLNNSKFYKKLEEAEHKVKKILSECGYDPNNNIGFNI